MSGFNGIQRNLTGSKISMSSTKFVFFWPIGKTRWPPWPLIGWDIFDFSSETAERNWTKLDRKQDLNVFYQVCVYRADQSTKMFALADSSKRWQIVLRCTICVPLGLLFAISTKIGTGKNNAIHSRTCKKRCLYKLDVECLFIDLQRRLDASNDNNEQLTEEKKQLVSRISLYFCSHLVLCTDLYLYIVVRHAHTLSSIRLMEI